MMSEVNDLKDRLAKVSKELKDFKGLMRTNEAFTHEVGTAINAIFNENGFHRVQFDLDFDFEDDMIVLNATNEETRLLFIAMGQPTAVFMLQMIQQDEAIDAELMKQAKKYMMRFNLEDFKATHPKLYKTIIETVKAFN